MDSVHQFELQWIQELHRFRTPLLDSWFGFCDFFDTAYFIISLIVGVGIFYNRKLGWRLLIIFTINSLVNKFLKHAFDLPRPHDLDSQLGIINLSSPGFPSGAAQSAVLLCGILIKEGKSWWRFVIGPLFAVNLCLSRIYLGVHFPSDVLGGIIVGLVLLWGYIKFLRP